MAKEHLSIQPQNVRNDKRTWYYEETRHIYIVHQDDKGGFHNIKIPWHMLRKSLRRRDAE